MKKMNLNINHPLRWMMILSLFMLCTLTAWSQGWRQVWADEFNGSIGPDWVFETGGGGWGNNELQYYRQENATIRNGELIITAKNESFGGRNYTSARLKTQGKKSWKYGRMEARIAMPAFDGVWPAFWMLGDNISTVGWPSCGEIDVMEHVNAELKTYGTIHWSDNNGNYANYGGNTAIDLTQYHVYAVEWDANAIRWYVDNTKYHEVNIAGGVNGTSEFHNNFFILLNMAIGGNWPGFNINNGAMPAEMRVDYVRVFEWSNAPTGVTNLSGQYYIQNRKSGLYIDVDNWGTQDGANLLQWNYHGGNNQKFQFIHQGNGVYIIKSVHSGKVMDVSGISYNNGANIQQWTDYGTANQRWIVTNAGNGYYQLVASHSLKVAEIVNGSTAPGANVQQYDNNNQLTSHWALIPVAASWSTQIEAENWAVMSGVQTEACSEGGLNVGWIDANDWLVWDVNIPSAGSYKVEYRVASPSGGGSLQLEKAGGSPVYGSIGIPATGGWQNWSTISHTVNLSAGQQQIAVKILNGGWNLNWIKISTNSGARVTEETDELTQLNQTFNLYPNPVKDHLNLQIPDGQQIQKLMIHNIGGQLIWSKSGEFSTDQSSFDISSLSKGQYILTIKTESEVKQIKMLKE